MHGKQPRLGPAANGYNFRQLAFISNARFNPPIGVDLILCGNAIPYSLNQDLWSDTCLPQNPLSRRQFDSIAGAPLNGAAFPFAGEDCSLAARPVLDHAFTGGGETRHVASSAGAGFGLPRFCLAVARRWMESAAPGRRGTPACAISFTTRPQACSAGSTDSPGARNRLRSKPCWRV